MESEGKCGSGYAQYECLGGGLYQALSCALSRASDSEWLCVAHDMTHDLTSAGGSKTLTVLGQTVAKKSGG